DGGFLEESEEMDEIVIGPAERAEILVDFSDFKKGETVQLDNNGLEFMTFKTNSESVDNGTVPTKLTTIEKINSNQTVKTRKFTFEGMGPMVNINGKQFDVDRIDEELNI